MSKRPRGGGQRRTSGRMKLALWPAERPEGIERPLISVARLEGWGKCVECGRMHPYQFGCMAGDEVIEAISLMDTPELVVRKLSDW